MPSDYLQHPEFGRDRAARLAEACGQLRLALLCAALIGVPFALGGRADWTLPAMGLVNAAGFALLFLELGLSNRKLRFHRSWVYGAAILALLCVQVVPNENWTALLAPEAADIWRQAREAGLTDLRATLSLAPIRTRTALIMLAQIGLTGVLIQNTCTTRRRLLLLAATIVAAALANAIAAFVPIVFDSRPLFAGLGISGRPLSGTFLNRNHFGFLMMIGVIQLAGIAWAIYAAQPGFAGQRPDPMRSEDSLFARRFGLLLTICAAAAVPMFMALLFSLSRGAAIAATVGLVLFAWASMKSGTAGPKREIFVPVAFFVGACVYGGIEALTALKDRYEALMDLGNLGLTGRWNVWAETLQLIRRFPLTGVGLHAFEPASPMVESGFIAGRISFHAHNDYLELVSEVGIPLGLLILGLIGIAMVRLWRHAVNCSDRCCRAIAVAAVCALTAGAVHQLLDYNVRAPANGILAVALGVLALAAPRIGRTNSKETAQRETTPQPSHSRKRRSAGLQSNSIGRRAGFAAAAVTVMAAGLWFYVPRIKAGNDLMKLRDIAQSSAAFQNTGVARRMQADYCVNKAESILAVMPDNERANYYRAIYLQIMASAVSRQYAGEQATAEQMQTVVGTVLASRQAARQLAGYLPTNGYYQALYGKQLNLSAWYDDNVDIAEIIRVLETAHARYPNVPQVTRLCLQAFAEILQVDRDELSANELERLERTFIDMGRSLLEQQPAQSAEIFDILSAMFPDPAALIDITPPRLLAYEPLFEMLFRSGRYDDCRRILEIMKQINQTRLTREDQEKISLYELVRTHPASRDEMTVRIIRRKCAVASVTGNWETYAALRSRDYTAQRRVCRKRLRDARAAAEAADLHQAIRIGRRMRRECPENPDVQIALAEWLITVGNYAEAFDCLQPLVWLDDVSPATLRRGVTAAEQLSAVQRFRHGAQAVNDILISRLAVTAQHVDAQRLNAVAARLERDAADARAHAAASRAYEHLAFFYAGRYAEINGDNERAVQLYREALTRCPLHYKTMRRVMDLPVNVAHGIQSAVQDMLGETPVGLRDLENDLVDLAPGVKLRCLTIEPRQIEPYDLVTITAAVELTGEVAAIPPLKLTMLAADGMEIVWISDDTKRNWGIPPEQMKIGRIVTVKTHVAPGTAALGRAQVLPEGTVHIAVSGAARDRGFTFYHPGFSVRRRQAKSRVPSDESAKK